MFNYFSHIIYDNKYYQNRFENEYFGTENETIKRVATVALPLISLYTPIAKGIALTTGTIRTLCQLSESNAALYRKDWWALSYHSTQIILSIVAVAATIFNFQLGLLFTTIVDIGVSLKVVFGHIKNGTLEKNIDELLQIASSMFYLAIMLTGSLECTLASILLQGALTLYQAKAEWDKEHWPECTAKVIMSMLRFNQAYQCIEQIKQRNALLTLDKYIELMKKITKGREAFHLVDSPLQDKVNDNFQQPYTELSKHINGYEMNLPLDDDQFFMTDANGNKFNFGEHVSTYGKGLVKGMNLQFRTTVIDGQELKEIDFKVNHVFRRQLQETIDSLKDFNSNELKNFLELTQSHAKGLKLELVPFELNAETKQHIGTAYQLTFDGLGRVLIGSSADMPNMYDRIRFLIDHDKSIYDVHEMMSFLNLDDAFKVSCEDDIERLKIGQLYRIFYPKNATLLERDNQYFELPLDQLKEKIVSENPSMQAILQEMLPTMSTEEIFPGRLRYTVPQISNIVKEQGGGALISTITGVSSNQSCQRLASILKMGLLSTEARFRHGMQVGGLSSNFDFSTGGADSVFTQFLTQTNFSEKMSLNKLYGGDLRILISLDALNTGTYQYNFDGFGIRNSDAYLNRPSIFEFVAKENNFFHHGNEVMIKERLNPSYITGVIVSSESMRQELINTLRNQGLVSSTAEVETIMNIPLNKFINVASELSESMLN